jgi:hypothetical protein
LRQLPGNEYAETEMSDFLESLLIPERYHYPNYLLPFAGKFTMVIDSVPMWFKVV